MVFLNSSNTQNKTEFKDFNMILGEVMGYYFIPGICFFGVITNVIFCSILHKLKDRPRFYNILLAKQSIDTLTSLIGIGWQNFHCTFCEDQVQNTYLFHFIRVYLSRFPLSVLYFNSVFLDILIIK